MNGNYQAGQMQPPTPAAPVGFAASRLNAAINDLAAVADNLESRLGDVLSPQEHDAGAGPALSAAKSVPLANSIHEQADRILRISAGLESVLERLGL